jgi:hypothetical protein
MQKDSEYIFSLGSPIPIKKWSAVSGAWITYRITPIWNSKHFALIPSLYDIDQVGLVHLPTQRILVHGKVRNLKCIAEDMENIEYMTYNLDYLPSKLRNELLLRIFSQVKI